MCLYIYIYMGVCMCEPEQHEILDGPTSAQQQSCLVHRKFSFLRKLLEFH